MSPEELFAKVSPAVVRIEVYDKNFRRIGFGSGFFVSADGFLVTNHHVVRNARLAKVRLTSNAALFVDGIAAVDADADLALLKVNARGMTFLDLDDGELPKVGVRVYAIGNPEGFTNTLSEGLVSGHPRMAGMTFIQTNAPMSHGSSGGPLLTANGKVVGVTSGIWRRGQNINFAVPASQIARLIRSKGKLRPLASAGGKRLDKSASEELTKAWKAMARDDWTAAAKTLTALRETHEDNPVVLFSLGYLHGKLGNHEIAIQHYEKTVSLKPDCAVAYLNMGISHAALGKSKEAISCYEKALAVEPDYAYAYFCMGLRYGALKQYGDAIACYEKAIALNPRDADYYCFLGLAKSALRRYSDAIAAYRKAIAVDPTLARAYYLLGLTHHELRDYRKAISAYEQVVRVAPDSREATSARTHIRALRPLADQQRSSTPPSRKSVREQQAEVYLGRALTYLGIGETRRAAIILRSIIGGYPETTAAQRAKSELRRLGVDPK